MVWTHGCGWINRGLQQYMPIDTKLEHGLEVKVRHVARTGIMIQLKLVKGGVDEGDEDGRGYYTTRCKKSVNTAGEALDKD